MRTILYIEDNFHNRRLVRKILKSRGYHVIEAEDGHAGWQMVQELHPPLVLMDISIPGIDGMEVTRRIKEEPSLRHIPVIAITAAAMRGDKERFLKGGCDDYLSKPIDPLDLLKKIADHYPSSEQ